MTSHPRIAASILILCAVGIGPVPLVRAQSVHSDEKSIRTVLDKLKDEDSDISDPACEQLIQMGPSAIPIVLKHLSAEKDCTSRVNATRVLSRLDPGNPAIVSTLRDVTLEACYWSPEHDIDVRRHAAMLLATYPEGVDVLATVLTGSRTFNRQSAAFAFDELTEAFLGDPPAGLATPAMIGAMERAVAALRTAMGDRDEVVRCVALESLDQLSRTSNPTLQKLALEAIEAVQSDCGQGVIRSLPRVWGGGRG